MKALIPEALQTGRLTYEAIRADQGPKLEPLLLDPRVYRTLHPGEPPTAVDVRRHAEAKHEHWRSGRSVCIGSWRTRCPRTSRPGA